MHLVDSNPQPFGQAEHPTIWLNVLLNKHLTIWPSWPNDWAMLWVLICSMHLTVCSYHVTYTFQSEFTLCSWLNVKELFARSMLKIWSLSNCNWTRTHNRLVYKRTPNHLAKLAKWLSCVVSTCLCDAFDSMFLSCHVGISEWIHTL